MGMRFESSTTIATQVAGLLSDISDHSRFVDAEPHRTWIHPLVYLVLGTLMLWGSIGFMWVFLPLAWPEEIPSRRAEQLSVIVLFIAPITLIGLYIWFLHVLEQFVLGPIFYALAVVGCWFSGIVAGWLCLGPLMIEWRDGRSVISLHRSRQLTNFGSCVLAPERSPLPTYAKWLPVAGQFAAAIFMFLIPALLVLPFWTPVTEPYFGPVLITAGVLGYASWQTAKMAFHSARPLLNPSVALDSYQTILNDAWSLALTGVRYRDFSDELLTDAAAISHNSELGPLQRLGLHELCIMAAIDRGESRIAAEWIASAAAIVNALDGHPGAFSSRCWLMFDEVTYFTATYSRDLDAAVWWLAAANRYPWSERYRRLASEAAVLFTLGDVEGACLRAKASIWHADQALLAGDAALVRERMLALLSNLTATSRVTS